MAFEIFREETEKLFKYSKNPHIHVANFPPSISLADFETQKINPSKRAFEKYKSQGLFSEFYGSAYQKLPSVLRV